VDGAHKNLAEARANPDGEWMLRQALARVYEMLGKLRNAPETN